jgi:hypothetical protein
MNRIAMINRTRKIPGGKINAVNVFFRRKPRDSICTSPYQNPAYSATICNPQAAAMFPIGDRG